MPLVGSYFDLWIGLALLGWCGALTIHKQLTVIRTVSEVIETPFIPSNRVNQQTQDAIKISTLSQLLNSPNSEIRDASMKIVAQRGLQSPIVWRLLRRKLRSRTECNQALRILVHFGPGSTYDDRLRRTELDRVEDDEFFHPATYAAMVACMCNMLPAAREAEKLHQHHDSAEADALWLAYTLLYHNSALMVRAGLVRKWLAQYPLNVRTPEKTKEEVIKEIITNYEYDDDYERLLCCVLCDLTKNDQALRQMVERGLGGPTLPHAIWKYCAGQGWGARQQYQNPPDLDRQLDASERENSLGGVQDVVAAMMDLSRTMGEGHDARAQAEAFVRNFDRNGPTQSDAENPVEHTPPVHHGEHFSRRREESTEERALRNRRREAMVFAEAGRPLRRGDIIESRRRANLDDVSEDGLDRMYEDDEGLVAVQSNGETARHQRTWVEFLARLRPDGSVRE